MLCRSSLPLSSSVFTHLHSDSSAARSSATSEYGTVLERPARNEEQNSKNEERNKIKRSSGPKSKRSLNEEQAQADHKYIFDMKSWIIFITPIHSDEWYL